MTECAHSWGFRVKENQKDSKARQVMVEDSQIPVVQGLDFKLIHDDLLVVVGPVGAGKSTLLHAIMEET